MYVRFMYVHACVDCIQTFMCSASSGLCLLEQGRGVCMCVCVCVYVRVFMCVCVSVYVPLCAVRMVACIHPFECATD